MTDNDKKTVSFTRCTAIIFLATKEISKQEEEIRREIAREFDLPERKSKIATILKQEDQAYCICRSSDCSRFMM